MDWKWDKCFSMSWYKSNVVEKDVHVHSNYCPSLRSFISVRKEVGTCTFAVWFFSLEMMAILDITYYVLVDISKLWVKNEFSLVFQCGNESARLDTYLDIPLVIRPFGSNESHSSVVSTSLWNTEVVFNSYLCFLLGNV